MNLENTKKLFCGIDPSLSGTGLVIINENNEILEQQLITTTNHKNDIYDIEKRIIYITKNLECLLKYKNDLKLILIEGISFGSRGDGAAQLAALNYAIRIWLFLSGFKYDNSSPSTLKKFVTGKGNCKKNLMLKEVYKKWAVDLNDDNLADSYALARFALENYKLKRK